MFDTAQRKNPSEPSGLSGRLKSLLLGTVFGLAAAVLFSVLFSLLLPMSFVPDEMVSVCACAAVFFGAFVSGFVSLRLIGSSGLVNGLFAGILFAAVHLLAAMVSGGVFSGPMIFICLGLEILGAAVGGLVSVNAK